MAASSPAEFDSFLEQVVLDELADGMDISFSDPLPKLVAEFIARRRAVLGTARIEDYVGQTVPTYSDPLFKAHFRMTRTTFQNRRDVSRHLENNRETPPAPYRGRSTKLQRALAFRSRALAAPTGTRVVEHASAAFVRRIVSFETPFRLPLPHHVRILMLHSSLASSSVRASMWPADDVSFSSCLSFVQFPQAGDGGGGQKSTKAVAGG